MGTGHRKYKKFHSMVSYINLIVAYQTRKIKQEPLWTEQEEKSEKKEELSLLTQGESPTWSQL